MKDGDVRVDKCIVQRQRGTYAVGVSSGNRTVSATFHTLAEARAFRDDILAKRPKRDYSHLGKKGRIGPDLICAMETATREENRRLIASSPRSKRVINGREFTVVHLPPVGAAA